MRLLDKICREPESIIRYSRTMDLIAMHFMDSNNVPLSQADVGVRARLLQFYGNHAVVSGNPQYRLTVELLQSLSDDISSLQERSVINMMDAFIKIAQTDHRTLKQKSQDVAIQLHNLVNEMAQRNADLVDIHFLISYLGRFVQVPYFSERRNNLGTNHLADLLRDKLEDPEIA